jgi:hypothetical protein
MAGSATPPEMVELTEPPRNTAPMVSITCCVFVCLFKKTCTRVCACNNMRARWVVGVCGSGPHTPTAHCPAGAVHAGLTTTHHGDADGGLQGQCARAHAGGEGIGDVCVAAQGAGQAAAAREAVRVCVIGATEALCACCRLCWQACAVGGIVLVCVVMMGVGFARMQAHWEATHHSRQCHRPSAMPRSLRTAQQAVAAHMSGTQAAPVVGGSLAHRYCAGRANERHADRPAATARSPTGSHDSAHATVLVQTPVWPVLASTRAGHTGQPCCVSPRRGDDVAHAP